MLDPDRSSVLLGEYALGDVEPEDMLEGDGGPCDVLPDVE